MLLEIYKELFVYPKLKFDCVRLSFLGSCRSETANIHRGGPGSIFIQIPYCYLNKTTAVIKQRLI